MTIRRTRRVVGILTIGGALCLATPSCVSPTPAGNPAQGQEPAVSEQELVLTIPGPDPVRLRMRRIEAGTYVRGSRDTGKGIHDDEFPLHEVTISQPFYLGIFEVTQDQWGAVMGDDPSRFKGLHNPVETVSWEDCMEFIARLNKMGIGAFRLPTEAEWEYACRAGNTGPYAGRLAQMGWYDRNSDGKTHPVGQKKPNAWGLYDMHGNVWEWCADWYGPYEAGMKTDPTGPVSGSYRVRRGGDYNSSAEYARSANRSFIKSSYRYYDLGFRLVRELP